MARHITPEVPTVLLVEDSQDDRTMYAEYLRIQQFRAVEIDNTADALALAPTADAVVTSIRVPGPFDGIELVRRLREDDRTKQKPLIVLTRFPNLPVMPSAFFGRESEELRGVVVEDVLLFLDRQKTQAIDAIDGQRDGLGPEHLVAPEHHTVQQPPPLRLFEEGPSRSPAIGVQLSAPIST